MTTISIGHNLAVFALVSTFLAIQLLASYATWSYFKQTDQGRVPRIQQDMRPKLDLVLQVTSVFTKCQFSGAAMKAKIKAKDLTPTRVKTYGCCT
eukprot:6193940-Pleurochrysis_carterae.AAC.2